MDEYGQILPFRRNFEYSHVLEVGAVVARCEPGWFSVRD